MTYPEFLERLSELRGQFHLDERGQIRALTLPNLCPIEAVENYIKGCLGLPIGRAIGINSEFMRTQIICAADNRPSAPTIRTDLLRVLGLSGGGGS